MTRLCRTGREVVGLARRLAAWPVACAALWLNGAEEEEQGWPGLFPPL